MGLIQFDFLFAEQISETDNTVEYRCTMDRKLTNASHTFTIDKSVFDEVSMHENDLAGYALFCMEQGKIEIPGMKVTKDTLLTEIEFDRIAAIRYIMASYLQENEIPKQVGVLSPEFKKKLEEIENLTRN